MHDPFSIVTSEEKAQLLSQATTGENTNLKLFNDLLEAKALEKNIQQGQAQVRAEKPQGLNPLALSEVISKLQKLELERMSSDTTGSGTSLDSATKENQPVAGTQRTTDSTPPPSPKLQMREKEKHSPISRDDNGSEGSWFDRQRQDRPKETSASKDLWKLGVGAAGIMVVISLIGTVIVVWRRRKQRRRKEKDLRCRYNVVPAQLDWEYEDATLPIIRKLTNKDVICK